MSQGQYWIEDLRYSIEVFSETGNLVEVLARLRDLAAARASFDVCRRKYPKKLILLCQGGRVLRRSDQGDESESAHAVTTRLQKTPAAKGGCRRWRGW